MSPLFLARLRAGCKSLANRLYRQWLIWRLQDTYAEIARLSHQQTLLTRRFAGTPPASKEVIAPSTHSRRMRVR